MKKLLFLLAVLLGFVSGIKAQEDVTAQYLTNADFSQSTAIDNHLCGYGADMTKNSTTYYGLQDVTGWTKVVLSGDNSNATYPNSGMGGAVFAYGSAYQLKGNNVAAPATNPNGEATGNALGFFAVWSQGGYYYQEVTLPAGTYTLTVPTYCQSGTQANTSYIGFITNGASYLGVANTAVGSWVNQTVNFTLLQETSGKIALGYKSTGGGSAANPHLFFDKVTLSYSSEIAYPIDMTGYITNPNFDSNTSGWTTTTGAQNSACASNQTGAFNVPFWENWNGTSFTGKMYQVINGLPQGVYTLTLCAFVNNLGEAGTQYVYGNGKKTNLTTGQPTKYTVEGINVIDGKLEIGFEQTAAVANWVGIDNATLTLTGALDLTVFVEAYEAALSAAKEKAATTEKISATVLAALNATITKYDDGQVDKESQEALETATDALSDATAAANTSIASYAVIAAGVVPDNSLNGWVCENTNTFHINTWSVEGNPGNDPSGMVTPFIENWVGKGSLLGAGKVYYQLQGIEPGEVYYAQALVRSYNEASSDAPNGPNFFINSKQVDMTEAGKTFTYNNMSGIYATLGGAAVVGEDGILKLGVEIAENRNYNWVAFKSISIRPMSDAWNEAVNAAKAVDQNAPMNAVVLSALQAAISNHGTTEPTTAEGYEEAIDALNEATVAAAASVANYEEAAAVINAASILDEAGQAAYAANEAVVGLKAAYEDGTLEAVSDEQKTACQAAFVVATRAQTSDNTNWTGVVVNNSFETGDFSGWTNNGLEAQNNTSFAKDGVWYAEKWQPNGTFSVEQTIENLPMGNYRVSAATLARGVTSAKIYANGTETPITVSEEAGTYTADVTVVKTLKIGFEGEGTGAGNSWLCVDNFQLTFLSGATELKAEYDAIQALIDRANAVGDQSEATKNATDAAVVAAKALTDAESIDIEALQAAKTTLGTAVEASEASAAIYAKIAEAEALAADDDAVAVGKLRDAIDAFKALETVTDEDVATLQAAIDQFNADNADQESDQTAKVAVDGWKKFEGNDAAGVCGTQYAPAINTYDGRTNVNLRENYESTAATTGQIIYQNITGLTNGTYKVGFYANAFFTSGRGFDSDMADGAEDVAYVFANDQQEFIVAHIATSTTENNFRQFDVEVTDGTIKLGMGKAKAGTNWHSMQIYQLTWFTSAKALYALDKAEMAAAIAKAEALHADAYKTNGKEEFAAAIEAAQAAQASNKLNIAEFEAAIAALNAAIDAFKAANYVAFDGKYYVKNADGKYMAAGHAWGTRGIVNAAGLDLTLTADESKKVKIDSRVSNGGESHFLSDGLYMDGGAFAWAIEQIGVDEYSIGNGAQYIGVDEDDNLAFVSEPYAWQFIDAATLEAARMTDGLAAMAEATADNGVDATFLLKDADFNRNDQRQEAWTVEFVSGNNKNLGGGCDGGNGNGNAESYHSAFNIYQTIANAPAGVYKLTAQGFYRQDDNVVEAAPVFYIGDATAEVPVKTGDEGSMKDASYSFTEGKYTIDPIEFTLNEDGALTVGVKNGENEHQWVIFDNFRLTYFGPAPAPVKYAITVADTENGTVVADKAEAEEGETVTLTATPAANYQFASAYYMLNEEKVDITIDGNTASFAMPAAAVNVIAAFEPKTDYTDYIVNANLTGTDPKGFDDAGTKFIDGSGIVKASSGKQYDFKQTISLPAGQYKLTAQAAYRFSGSEADEANFIANGETTKFASLYATIGEKTVSTLVQNRYDGASETDYAAGSGSVVVNEKYVPNSSSAVQAWFNAGQYVNEVTFNLTADGDVTIGIAKDAQPAAGDYTVIGPWTLTRLGDPVTMYAITVGETENGSVSVDKTEAASGETVTVTVTPDAGYELDFLGYSRGMIGVIIPVENNVGTFTMPADAVTVNASFKEVEDLSYKFVPSEWIAGDAGRISPENVTADDEAGTITVDKSGANNVALVFRSAKTYEVKAEQRYFVIKATGLSTGEAASYLWWLNNTNNGSQIEPTSIYEEEGKTVFAWDCVTIPIGGKLGIEDTEFTDQGGWSTTFGMTLADDAVPAVISYIGFQESIPEPVEEFAYEFVPSEWVAGDAGRISPENVTADDDMRTITVNKTGDNNVNLNFKTSKTYYVENIEYFYIKAKGISTEDGKSYLWWLNGKNDNGAQVAPTHIKTEADGTIILEWRIDECGNIGENINATGRSYLAGGDGLNTTFGLTQADDAVPVVITEIGYSNDSPTGISLIESESAEGALKDGKYLINGKIVIVKNGKQYNAAGQLK